MTAAQGHALSAVPVQSGAEPAPVDESAWLRSPRLTSDEGHSSHPRHKRVPIILESACEEPSTLLALLGDARIAALMGLPEAAIGTFTHARTGLQRRFAARLRERLGLTRRHVAAARRIPGDPAIILRAVSFFATTMRLADTPRVMGRDAMRRLAERYGEEALAFALIQRPLLTQSIDSLREFISEPAVNDADKRMFVRALAAHGHDGAACIALLLDLPVDIATRSFTDRFDAVITGLPTLAARALTRVIEDCTDTDATKDAGGGSGHSVMPSPEEVRAAEAQWRADGLVDNSAVAVGDRAFGVSMSGQTAIGKDVSPGGENDEPAA